MILDYDIDNNFSKGKNINNDLYGLVIYYLYQLINNNKL